MTPDPDDIVKVATGDPVEIDVYKMALQDAGIGGRVVGQDLAAGLGSILPGSMELWVRAADAERAQQVIQLVEESRRSKRDARTPKENGPVQ